MTSGIYTDDESVLAALRDCPEAKRDGAAGGWHPQAIASENEITVSAARKRLNSLCEQGVVVRVWGISPNGPRYSYLPADHPDAPSEDDDSDDGRVWVGETLE
jgi:hypothetical protein